jgi:rhodanese-related sulfurtransferase
MRVLLLIVVSVLGPRWITKLIATLTRMAFESTDYSPQQVAELHARGEIQLIDVRTAEEHDAGRIAGDRLVELTQLAVEAESIDRNTRVVFYCRSGSRSGMATAAFRRAGYDAHNMAGGLLDWHAAGLPLEPRGGVVAD